jgi:hypothetical protein
MQTFKASLFAALALASASCATLVSSSEYQMRVESQTPGATVRAFYRQNAPAFYEASAPAAFTFDFGKMSFAENAAFMEISAPGYATQKIALLKDIDWWVVGNIWFWPIGLVDLSTGAMWKPQQTEYLIKLERAGQR